MNKKLLCAALLSGLAVAQAASAQDFDNRWYLTTSAGFNHQDSDRGTHNAPFGTIGFGKFISDKWSLDGEFNYQNPRFVQNTLPQRALVSKNNLNWSQ